jgi:hypothetical protein
MRKQRQNLWTRTRLWLRSMYAASLLFVSSRSRYVTNRLTRWKIQRMNVVEQGLSAYRSPHVPTVQIRKAHDVHARPTSPTHEHRKLHMRPNTSPTGFRKERLLQVDKFYFFVELTACGSKMSQVLKAVACRRLKMGELFFLLSCGVVC